MAVLDAGRLLYLCMEKSNRRENVNGKKRLLVEIDADDAAVGRQCVEGFFGFKDSGIELCSD